MARPLILNDQINYAPVWDGLLGVGANVQNPNRAIPQKHFYGFIELYEQTAHDAALHPFIRRMGGNPRLPMHRGLVQPPNNIQDPIPYYRAHGQVAGQIVAQQMHTIWNNNPNPLATVFRVGVARPLTVQGVQQPNGFHYEITMWYDVVDIYFAFHCYHG
jgi:hypothetical protein